MKPKFTRLFPSALVVVFATAATTAMSHAANGTWTNAASGNWTTGPWTPGVPNAANETATFNQDWTGQVINVDTAFTVGQILATDTTANGGLTISGGTLTLDNGGSSPIISTDTNNAFGESAVNRFKMSSVLDGTSGFERQGNGYLDLSGVTSIFAGTIKLTAAASGGGSFTVINSDANLGNAANVITVALSGQPVGFYNDASASSFTLNSARTITTSGSGALWVKNKSGANMTIAGVISGTAQLRKNDSGTLTLTGANTFTGGTLLDGGTLVLSGGDNRLASDRAVTFNSVSTLNLTSTSQTVTGLGLLGNGTTNTISGAGGTLIYNAASDQTWNTTANGTTVNMAGLGNFTFNGLTRSFQINSNGANVVNTVNLAKAGTNTINVTNARFGGGVALAAGQNVLVGLGQNNNINASGEFVIGFFLGSGDVSFQSGLTSPTLTVRGAGGVGATPVMSVGSTNSGNQPSTGILNLTGGSLDVIATDLYVARHFSTDTSVASTGTLTMPAGTVVATTLNLAAKTNTTGTIGAPTLTGTFNQSGGNVTATTVNLGINAGITLPNLIANYNLIGGTLTATTIQRSAPTSGVNSASNLVLRGGTLTHMTGADLTINGVTTVVAGNTLTTLSATSGRKVVFGSTATYSARFNSFAGTSGALTVSGDLDLTASPAFNVFDDAVAVSTPLAPGTKLVLIDYSGGTLTGQFASLAEGDPVSVTKGAVTNNFVISYVDINRVTLTIPAASNFPPTISDITDQSVPSGGTVGPLDFTVGDLETAVGSLSLSVSANSNTGLVPNANIVFGGSGAGRTVTLTPVSGFSGTATITIRVTDGGALFDEDTFVLTVTDNFLSWATANGVTGGPNGDSDFDGVPNLVEYALLDGGERGVFNPTTNIITFNKRLAPYGTDLTYDIESSTLLTPGSWTTLAEPPVVKSSSAISYTLAPPTPVKNFVRLKVVKVP